MRTSLTFILRVLLETDQPFVLRGTVQAVMDDRVEAFTDEKRMLEVLYSMILNFLHAQLSDDEAASSPAPPNSIKDIP